MLGDHITTVILLNVINLAFFKEHILKAMADLNHQCKDILSYSLFLAKSEKNRFQKRVI